MQPLELVLSPESRINTATAGESLSPSPLVRTSQKTLAALWAEDLAAQCSAGLKAPRTCGAYREQVGAWLEFLAREGIHTPTPAHVLGWIASLRQRLAPASVNASLAAVKAFYAWTETRNAFPNIARSVRGLTVRKDEPLDALTPAEVAKLARLAQSEALAGLRDCALVHTLYATACRCVSIHGANVGDLDLLDAALRYQGKGDIHKARRAILGPTALEAVRRYLQARQKAEGKPLDKSAPLFAAVGNRGRAGRLTDRSIRRIICGLMTRAGHLTRDEKGHITRPRVLGVHSLRRSAVTAAYDRAGLEAAQTLAGHADPRTTTRAYARVNRGKVLRELANALDLGGAEQ